VSRPIDSNRVLQDLLAEWEANSRAAIAAIDAGSVVSLGAALDSKRELQELIDSCCPEPDQLPSSVRRRFEALRELEELLKEKLRGRLDQLGERIRATESGQSKARQLNRAYGGSPDPHPPSHWRQQI
jgi:hypothetical protein